jgi:ribosomal protein S27E
MNFNKVQCPKCGYEANAATALNCKVCTHPLREDIVPVKGRRAVVGKGALSSKNLRMGSNPSKRKSPPIKKNPAPLRWIALALPSLLIGAGYLIGSNSGTSKLSNSMPSNNNIPANSVPANSIPTPINNIPAPSSKPFVNQSPQITQTQRVEVPAKEPLEKPPTAVKTKESKPSKQSVVPLQKETPQATPLLPSPIKPPVQTKSKVKPTELTVERPPSQSSQPVEAKESKPAVDTPSAVVIDSAEANAVTPASMDCYGGQSQQSSSCRNRKN